MRLVDAVSDVQNCFPNLTTSLKNGSRFFLSSNSRKSLGQGRKEAKVEAGLDFKWGWENSPAQLD